MPPVNLASRLDLIEEKLRAIADQLSEIGDLLGNLRHGVESSAPAQVKQSLPPGKMKKSILDRIIGSQYEDWISNRGTYNVKEFRRHCEPLLSKHFCHEDLEPDCDGTPKWYGRFSYAHKDIANQYDYIHGSGGVWVMCSC